MGRLPIDRSVLDSALERMDIADIAQATIRQSGDIARIMETQTGMEFLHLEMGVPGLPPEKAGVEAECRALQSGVASQYPNMFGIPELKQQTSRFIRAFLDVGQFYGFPALLAARAREGYDPLHRPRIPRAAQPGADPRYPQCVVRHL